MLMAITREVSSAFQVCELTHLDRVQIDVDRARAQLASIEPLLEMFSEDAKWDRIRLMRLSPEGGELDRHTDQVDPTLGVGLGDLMRVHIP